MIADFLRLCGFEPPELEKELPRAQEAFDKLGLTSEDIERGEERIVRFFDTGLKGVRKLLGVLVKELVELMLIKPEGKKILYTSYPTAGTDYLTAAMLHSEDVYTSAPHALFCYTMGSIFNKLSPLLRMAERLYLPPAAAHCSLVQLELGLHALNLVPRGDLLLSSAIVCDEVLKASELLEEFFGVPVHYISRCHDKDWGESEAAAREIEQLAGQLRKLEKRVSQTVGFEFTDDMMYEAREFKRKYSRPARRVMELIATSDPPPLSAAFSPIIRGLNTLCMSKAGTEAAAEAINILHEELEQRVSQGVGVVAKGAPRVMHGYVQSISDPSVVHFLEKAGIAVPAVELQLFAPYGRFVPNLEGIEGRHEREAAAILQGAVSNSLPLEIRSIVEACKRLKLDGLFWWIHHACRPMYAEALMVKDAVTRELGLPFMVLEADVYNPEFYSARQLQRDIDSFAAIVKDYCLR